MTFVVTCGIVGTRKSEAQWVGHQAESLAWADTAVVGQRHCKTRFLSLEGLQFIFEGSHLIGWRLLLLERVICFPWSGPIAIDVNNPFPGKYRLIRTNYCVHDQDKLTHDISCVGRQMGTPQNGQPLTSAFQSYWAEAGVLTVRVKAGHWEPQRVRLTAVGDH